MTRIRALNIVISSAAVRLASRHFGLVPIHASTAWMMVGSVAALVGVLVTWCLGLVVAWCLGGLQTLRGILLGTAAVFLAAVVLGLFL
jgi:hypothetical protein